MNNKYLLEITNLCKNYTNENNSKIEIIKNLNFKLKQNTKVSIVGPSGSGKTTFLNIIGLLDSEYDGNFYFKNKDISLCSKNETSFGKNIWTIRCSFKRWNDSTNQIRLLIHWSS